MIKQIQMPERFAILVTVLLSRLDGYDLEDHDRALCEEINGYITEKVEAMKRREAYSKSLLDKKNAP